MIFKTKLISLLTLSTLTFSAATILSTTLFEINPSIVNDKVTRLIDLQSQLVKVSTSITVENTGSKPIKSYVYQLEVAKVPYLSFIEATVNNEVQQIKRIDEQYFEILLDAGFAPANSISKRPLVITTIYTNYLKCLPRQITQSENQKVEYFGSQTATSPYLTKTQITKIKLPPRTVLESFSQADKLQVGTNKLTYGPFKDIPANTDGDKLHIHYENNSPFVAATYIEKYVEVSSWTNRAYVSNSVNLVHVGAELKGPFSRIDYQLDNDSGVSSVKNFLARLPRDAENIYFRDGIGNISTSSITRSPSEIKVAIKPRFPLFGGWKTDFVLGYDHKLNDITQLVIKFGDQIYENLYAEKHVLKIKLPPGSSNIQVTSAYNFKVKDIFIYVEKDNIVANHLDTKINIKYSYSRLSMLFEPAVVATVALALVTSSYVMMKSLLSK